MTSGRVSGHEFSASTFKLQVLRMLMQQVGLLEPEEGEDPDEAIERLNGWVEVYAGGRIGKPRLFPDNTLGLRVDPIDGGASFPFDGLGSGQKEIISTLFLAWHHTRNRPAVVLVDGPEWHLNAEWHRKFMKSLTRVAPQNQYLIATHSEDVMDAVERDRRVLLTSDA